MPSISAILGAIVAGSSITTGVFLFAYFLGKLRGDIDRTREQVAELGVGFVSHSRRIEKVEEYMVDDRRRAG